MSDDPGDISDLAAHRRRLEEARSKQHKLADVYRRATVSLDLQVSPETRELVKEIAKLRQCDPSRAVEHALADEHFLLRRNKEGWRVMLEKAGEEKEFPDINSMLKR